MLAVFHSRLSLPVWKTFKQMQVISLRAGTSCLRIWDLQNQLRLSVHQVKVGTQFYFQLVLYVLLFFSFCYSIVFHSLFLNDCICLTAVIIIIIIIMNSIRWGGLPSPVENFLCQTNSFTLSYWIWTVLIKMCEFYSIVPFVTDIIQIKCSGPWCLWAGAGWLWLNNPLTLGKKVSKTSKWKRDIFEKCPMNPCTL